MNPTTTTVAVAVKRSDAVALHDETLSTRALNGREMKFRARVFVHEPLTVVLLTDIGTDNPGASITNAIEYAFAATLERWWDLDPARIVLIEHYDDRQHIEAFRKKYGRQSKQAEIAQIGREHGESFDLVTFNCPHASIVEYVRRRLPVTVEATWSRVSKGYVETLIGGPLP